MAALPLLTQGFQHTGHITQALDHSTYRSNVGSAETRCRTMISSHRARPILITTIQLLSKYLRSNVHVSLGQQQFGHVRHPMSVSTPADLAEADIDVCFPASNELTSFRQCRFVCRKI